jgi:hypothetical protein
VYTLSKPKSQPYRPIDTAPRDGSVIEVRHGPDQATVHARWAAQNQGWIRSDDPDRRTLHRVTEWRPIE